MRRALVLAFVVFAAVPGLAANVDSAGDTLRPRRDERGGSHPRVAPTAA